MKRSFLVCSCLLLLAGTFLTAWPAAQRQDPVFPYGAVYFRKSNPPESDWERDHQTAARAGMNTMRHWYLWSAIEVAPGKYDWRDYDRIMELEAQHGIRVVIAEMITAAPEWMFKQYAHARFEAHDGYKGIPAISGSSVTGGFPGLCLDNDDVLRAAENFLKALATRYKDHPATYGYDLWNECNTSGGGGGYFQVASSAHIPNEHRSTSLGRMYCYCPATAAKFRAWVQKKYGTLEALGRAWHRHSFAEWQNVEPPRSGGPYPDWLDWLEFREDRAHELLRWRREAIRSVDQRNRITAHGIAYTLESLPSAAANDWRAAAEVETFGLTWIAARKGSQPWKQFHALDLVRAASRGKPFWHAEFQGGPLWMQGEVLNRPLEDGRKPDEKDIRLWNMVSFAGGASGLLYVRWRPLLDEVFGAREADVEFTPDLLEELNFRLGDETLRGRIFKQVYTPTSGKPAGWYADGAVAAVENGYGKGRTLLIGTFPGAAYFRKPEAGARRTFQNFLGWAKRGPQVTVSDPAVTARLHAGPGGTYLWVLNPTRSDKSVSVTLQPGPWRKVTQVWGDGPASVNGHTVRARIPERDAAVLRLE